jgi:hypothetical protein
MDGRHWILGIKDETRTRITSRKEIVKKAATFYTLTQHP